MTELASLSFLSSLPENWEATNAALSYLSQRPWYRAHTAQY